MASPNAKTGWPKWELYEYAKAKSKSSFENNLLLFTFIEVCGEYQIQQWQRVPRKGWIPNPERKELLPAGISLDEAITRFIIKLQNAKDN